MHASLLPKYRVLPQLTDCIINGENRGPGSLPAVWTPGYTDATETEIKDDETAGQLHDRLALLGAELLIETLGGVKGKRGECRTIRRRLCTAT